ncbi:DUF6766 family protein [Streptomyces sp. NPDC055254]
MRGGWGAVDGLQRIGLAQYVTTSDFAADVTENWQSEFSQFFLFVFGTGWPVQRGFESEPVGAVPTSTGVEG